MRREARIAGWWDPRRSDVPPLPLAKAMAVAVPPRAGCDWLWAALCMFAESDAADPPHVGVGGCSCLASEGSS